MNPLGLSLTFDVLTDSIEKKRDPEGYKARVAKTRARRRRRRARSGVGATWGLRFRANQSGFRFSLDFKQTAGGDPAPRNAAPRATPSSPSRRSPRRNASRAIALAEMQEAEATEARARFADALKHQLADKEEEHVATEKRLALAETECARRSASSPSLLEEVQVWKAKSETVEVKMSAALAAWRRREKKLLLAQKAQRQEGRRPGHRGEEAGERRGGCQILENQGGGVEFKLAEAVARLAELAEELATSEKKRKALERDAARVAWKAEKAAATGEETLRRPRGDVVLKLKVAAADETLAASAAKRKETENQLETLLKHRRSKSRADEASLSESLKTARASIETSEASATSLRRRRSACSPPPSRATRRS